MLKYGPIPASFCLFSSFSPTIRIGIQKIFGCAWESNLGPQNGRCRRIHWVMAAVLRCFKGFVNKLFTNVPNRVQHSRVAFPTTWYQTLGTLNRTKITNCILSPSLTLMAFTGVTNAHGPSPQPTPCIHHAVWQLQQEVTRPKERFKPNLPEKSNYKLICIVVVIRLKARSDLTQSVVKTDWAICWTLGHILKPLAIINLPKSPTF